MKGGIGIERKVFRVDSEEARTDLGQTLDNVIRCYVNLRANNENPWGLITHRPWFRL